MASKICIQTAINIIEQNIAHKINLDKLSSECFISPRQLYRDFYTYTGHSVNEYIRKRRISKALGLLKYSDMTISEITYASGYSSQQAFTKSVKTVTGLTPKQYRSSNYIYYFSVYNIKDMNQITIEYKTLSDMLAIRYYHHKLNELENEAIKFLFKLIPHYSGSLYGKNRKQAGRDFCYELYIDKNSENIKILEENNIEFSIKQSYTSLFAQTIVKNINSEINKSWNYFYNYWLKNSMFELSEASYFEQYLIKKGKITKLILHMAINRKENLSRISIQRFPERLFLVSKANGLLAENIATKNLTEFISNYHPYFYTTQKEYYIKKQNNEYICGINLNHKVSLPKNNIEHLGVPQGLYAVLEGSCFNNSDEYEQILISWLNENGIETDDEPFTVYDVSGGTKKDEVIANTQVKIKMAEKYNTN